MEGKKDYYEILGITEDEKKLSDDEFNKVLKKKYRVQAVKWHPDKWTGGTDEEKKTAEAKFKDIAEAYGVLSDKQKREIYDNGGNTDSFGGTNGFDPFDLFRSMHQGFGGFGSMFGNMGFGRGFNSQMNVGSDINASLEITIEEAFKGGRFKVKYQTERPCTSCNGTGSADGKTSECTFCHGTGRMRQQRQMGPNSFAISETICPHCKGTGKHITTPCAKCHGTGFELIDKEDEVLLPGGLTDGLSVAVPNQGAEAQGGGNRGDLIINIHVKPDPYFTIGANGLDIIHVEEVPFNECLLGFKKEFKTIDGGKVIVTAPELTASGTPFVFPGKGMPHVNKPSYKGNYIVVINHKFPKSLTKEQKEMLKKPWMK